MKYKNIIFDLDGTLIDSQKSAMDSVQYALRKFGIEPDYASLVSFFGPPLHKSFEEQFGFDEEKTMQAVRYFREYFREHGRKEITVIEGYHELLGKLVNQQKKLFIATQKPKPYAEEITKDLNLHQFFTAIIGNAIDSKAVEKDVLIGEVLKLIPKEPKNSCVMIGDSKYDILGAQKNEIDSVGVLFNNTLEKEILASNPTHIVRSVKKLEEILLPSNA